MGRDVHILLEGGSYFEGPRWHEGRWYVADFYRHAVLAVTQDGGEETVLEVEGQPSGLGWMPDGSLLVVSMKDRVVLRRHPEGAVKVHADLSGLCPFKANDMVVDGAGGAYVGQFGFDLMAGGDPVPTSLVRIDADGSASVAAEDMLFPNGMAITPDGTTLLVDETLGCRVSSFRILPDGSLTDRQVWAQLAPTPPAGLSFAEILGRLGATPDGCALDAEGHLWIADALACRAIRVAPGGEIIEEVRAPNGYGIFACMLGGDDGRTLLLCTAPDFSEENRKDTREAILFTTTVDVPHAGLP
jgi:sugar lactone lactonase YvrE